MPFVSRTRAAFRSAEFGFFGVRVKTRVQTPRFCGAPSRCGVFVFSAGVFRPFRTSWLIVGKGSPGLRAHTTKVGRGQAPANRGRHGSKACNPRQTPESRPGSRFAG